MDVLSLVDWASVNVPVVLSGLCLLAVCILIYLALYMRHFVGFVMRYWEDIASSRLLLLGLLHM
jgi:hypothetical protein